MALAVVCAACRDLFYIREGFYEHYFSTGGKVYVHVKCYEDQFGKDNSKKIMYE